MTYHELVRAYRKEIVTQMLRDCRGSRSVAAERLGLKRTYLCRLVRELEVDVPSAPSAVEGRLLARGLRAANGAHA